MGSKTATGRYSASSPPPLPPTSYPKSAEENAAPSHIANRLRRSRRAETQNLEILSKKFSILHTTIAANV